MRPVQIQTPHGAARAHWHPAETARAALVMCHGAGVGVDSPDLVIATEVANEAGVSVVLMEQPYLVAGRKAPAPPAQLDVAFTKVVEHLREHAIGGLPLIVGGRSMGARVACRTAGELGAIAVLCLAFPVRPPQRKGQPPKPDRLDELDAVEVPVLVVQGERDQFGVPPEGPGRKLELVAGNHSLKADLDALGAAVRSWLSSLLEEVPTRARS